MNFVYIYISVGLIISVISYFSYGKRDKDIAEEVQDKLHELSNDGSFSFNSANAIGHLLAFILSSLLWPILIIKQLSKRGGDGK